MISLRHIAASLALLAGAAAAQAPWPAKPIRLIVPFPPGGGTDFIARVIGERLSTALGATLVIDNKPGAGGNIGLDAVAKSPPDGYTLGLGQTANLAINPHLYAKMPYDALKDFTPVAAVASQPMVLVVTPQSAMHSVADVVTAAKVKPQGVRIGLAGSGTVGHLAGEMLERRANLQLLNIPYRGAAPALNDLLGGQFEIYFGNAASVLPQIGGGKLRPLAVTSATRLPALKDVPTMIEAGYAGFDAVTWSGLVAPAGTPPAIVARINAEVQKILKQPEVLAKLAAEGSTATGGSPAQFGDTIRSEHQKWGTLIRDADIKID
nr:tripartite tricarboxylate transporter substrate binding protein [uncultured Roseateles sp.]